MNEHTELPELSVGYKDRGLGHGHYAVLRKESGELFANVPFGDKNLAAELTRRCNAFPAMEAVLLNIQARIDSGEYLRVDDPEYADLVAALAVAESD